MANLDNYLFELFCIPGQCCDAVGHCLSPKTGGVLRLVLQRCFATLIDIETAARSLIKS